MQFYDITAVKLFETNSEIIVVSEIANEHFKPNANEHFITKCHSTETDLKLTLTDTSNGQKSFSSWGAKLCNK